MRFCRLWCVRLGRPACPVRSVGAQHAQLAQLGQAARRAWLVPQWRPLECWTTDCHGLSRSAGPKEAWLERCAAVHAALGQGIPRSGVGAAASGAPPCMIHYAIRFGVDPAPCPQTSCIAFAESMTLCNGLRAVSFRQNMTGMSASIMATIPGQRSAERLAGGAVRIDRQTPECVLWPLDVNRGRFSLVVLSSA